MIQKIWQQNIPTPWTSEQSFLKLLQYFFWSFKKTLKLAWVKINSQNLSKRVPYLRWRRLNPRFLTVPYILRLDWNKFLYCLFPTWVSVYLAGTAIYRHAWVNHWWRWPFWVLSTPPCQGRWSRPDRLAFRRLWYRRPLPMLCWTTSLFS